MGRYIYFIYNKKKNESVEELSNPFSKQNSLNRAGVNFPSFACSELIDVA